jgi:hypothetical protein
MVEVLTNLLIQSALDSADKVTVKTLIRLGQIAARMDKGAGRDLTVSTPQGDVRATGTEFSVRYDETPRPTTTVQVTEGAVEFAPREAPAAPVTVAAGQQVVVTPEGVGPVAASGQAAAAATGAGTTPAEPPTLPPEPAGPLGSGGMLDGEMLKATLTDQLDPDQRPVGAKESFSPETELVHLYVRMKQDPPGGSLIFTWFRDGQVIQKQVAQLAAKESFLVSIYDAKRPALPAGRWWVTIKTGATVVGSIPFRIGQ